MFLCERRTLKGFGLERCEQEDCASIEPFQSPVLVHFATKSTLMHWCILILWYTLIYFDTSVFLGSENRLASTSLRGGEMIEWSVNSISEKNNPLAALPPERTQPKKLCTANFSSGTLKTLIDRPLWLKNKIFWRRPAEKKHFSSLPRARTPLSSG